MVWVSLFQSSNWEFNDFEVYATPMDQKTCVGLVTNILMKVLVILEINPKQRKMMGYT